MSEEAWDNDFVGDSETNAATPDNSILDEPDDDKVDEVPFKDGDAEVQTENISKTKHRSTNHAIDINVSATSSIENEAKNTFGHRWIQPYLAGGNSTLACEIESYNKHLNEAKKKIQKVPTVLRGVGMVNKCYDPMIVSIGPYHYSTVKLKQMETFKIQFTRQYADQSGKLIKKLYEEMEDLLIEAKNYYDEDVAKAFSDTEFADMMFLDSCFVIQFMNSCVNFTENDINLKYIESALIMHDIMLLENQLPFKILTKLMGLSSRFEGDKGEKMIDNFIKLIMNEPSIEEEALRRKEEPIHLLELVQTKFVNDVEIKFKTCEFESFNWCSYRSVKELKSVGIYFRPSKTCRFSDIKFKSMCFCGRLTLPRIIIDNGTKSLLLNLVAFETCADKLSNLGVSSYVSFMDTLIDQAEDVKELRSKGIILNLLSSDDEVAKLFNEISKHVMPDYRIFWEVKVSLNDFYKSRIRLWLTEFLHNYFRSPWAIIAFIAAIIVLGLTITQTVFSAIQL